MKRTKQIAEKYQEIQEIICTTLEQADGIGKFSSNEWEKDIGGGKTNVMQNGAIIEKAGVNFSNVSGPFTSSMKSILGEEAREYSATGISSIIHSHNPFVPTIHINVRYFALDNGIEWFGGGIDLTPIYIDENEAAEFHKALKLICGRFSPTFYSKFKEWADNYFYLKHRNETRGIGGIFFDRLKPSIDIDFDELFSFTQVLANAYPTIYADIMSRKGSYTYSDKNKEWQKIRRGRYVEFNLVYDRGTKFGLETGGNTESILVSLPSEVKWVYNFQPEKGSEEEKTLNLLRKGINWAEI